MIPNHLNEVSFGGSSGTYVCMYSTKYKVYYLAHMGGPGRRIYSTVFINVIVHR